MRPMLTSRTGPHPSAGATGVAPNFVPCAVVPTLDNHLTLRMVVEELRRYEVPVFVVDDGSAPATRAVAETLATEGLATVLRHERNRGKGAACLTGMNAARALGFTHAFQVDADGQHDLAQVPAFLAAAARDPDAVVLGYPIYDASAPRTRRIARHITSFWVGLELGSWSAVKDALVGFRIYPLEAMARVPRVANRMGFDFEAAVRLVRGGARPINLPVGVRYPSADEGGVSHIRPFRDNLAFCVLHTRLCMEGLLAWLGRRVKGLGR